MSTADDLRAHAQRWPDSWSGIWEDDVSWDVASAFCCFREYFGELGSNSPWFLLLVAEALDGGRE